MKNHMVKVTDTEGMLQWVNKSLVQKVQLVRDKLGKRRSVCSLWA